jgi:protoheme IX farnesyltransferase
MPTLELRYPAALPADWRDFLALTKPRVMSLVVFTGLCGLLVAPVQLPVVLGFTAILCIALGAGACGALNQWYEVELDAKMRRTSKRPLPAGRMDRHSSNVSGRSKERMIASVSTPGAPLGPRTSVITPSPSC